MSLESRVRTVWGGGGGAPGLALRTALLPLEGLFRLGTAVRDAGFATGLLRAVPAPIPVIGVGNLSVGGTGKTPIAAHVVRVLLEAGARPALVARGYGRDELELHRAWNPGVEVHAGPDRVAVVRAAARAGATVAVLDDGFQHRRLARDLDVVLIAVEQGLPGPRLPRGPFREGPGALRRAGVVVVTRKTDAEPAAADLSLRAAAHAPHATRVRVHLAPGDWVDLGGSPVSGPAQARVLTAVAEPDTVRASAEAAGVDVESVCAFPDHHEFDDGDVATALAGWSGPVVTTEKDAMKLRDLAPARSADVRVLRQRIAFEEGEAAFRAAILRAAGLEGAGT